MSNQLIIVSLGTLLLTACSSCFPPISPEAMAIARENALPYNRGSENLVTVNTESTGPAETWYATPEYLSYTPAYNDETRPLSHWEKNITVW